MSEPVNARHNIGASQVTLPVLPNYVHVKEGGDESRLDVALLSDECLEDVGRKLGQAFVANAKKRREAK